MSSNKSNFGLPLWWVNCISFFANVSHINNDEASRVTVDIIPEVTKTQESNYQRENEKLTKQEARQKYISNKFYGST